MTVGQDSEAITALLRASHAAFAAGDADRFAAHFTDDARLYLLHSEPALGREAIRERWRAGFERYDTSAWEPTTELTELHDGHAVVFSTYTERLVERGTGQRTLVRGRLVHWLARGTGGTWRITFLMNSHSHPMEPIP